MEPKIFIVSDTHFGHKNIINCCDRPFFSVKHMDDSLIRWWNETVGQDDIVYHLGDFQFGMQTNKETFCEYISKLNGKIHFIKGNHDAPKDVEMSRLASFSEYIILEAYGKRILLIHYPIHRMAYEYKNPHIEYDLCLFGHVHNGPESYSLCDNKHCNVSLEKTNYRPVELKVLLGKV